MLRRVTFAIVQSRGIKHTVNVKWVRPDYVPAYKPEKSGDLKGLPSIPGSALGKLYADCDEIKDAPESVKKLFSIAHLGRKEFGVLVRQELVDRVRRHKYDECTAETKIAKITAHIRYLQDLMDKYPRNNRVKKTVQEQIDKRKKLLKYLRQYDYKKYEWLLEKLELEYKGHPESYHKLSRKESLRKLTEMHCDDIRGQKLDEYRNLLESQQGPYLKQKLDALKFIKSEQAELKLAITITDQDIKKVEEQLKQWTVKNEIKLQATKKKKNILLESE